MGYNLKKIIIKTNKQTNKQTKTKQKQKTKIKTKQKKTKQNKTNKQNNTCMPACRILLRAAVAKKENNLPKSYNLYHNQLHDNEMTSNLYIHLGYKSDHFSHSLSTNLPLIPAVLLAESVFLLPWRLPS